MISDICNQLEELIAPNVHGFVDPVLKVLESNDYTLETKLFAIISLGDLALAGEESFYPFLDKSFNCLMTAGQVSLNTKSDEFDEDLKELLLKLRHQLVDSFTSVFHGITSKLHDMNGRSSQTRAQIEHRNKAESYAT